MMTIALLLLSGHAATSASSPARGDRTDPVICRDERTTGSNLLRTCRRRSEWAAIERARRDVRSDGAALATPPAGGR